MWRAARTKLDTKRNLTSNPLGGDWDSLLVVGGHASYHMLRQAIVRRLVGIMREGVAMCLESQLPNIQGSSATADLFHGRMLAPAAV